MKRRALETAALTLAFVILGGCATLQGAGSREPEGFPGLPLRFADPAGDDHGPGRYSYPTDVAYKPGAFDLASFEVRQEGEQLVLEVGFQAALEDPWQLGSGFSVQRVAVFIDQDGDAGGGHRGGLPGLNVAFAEDAAWERAILLTPRAAAEVKAELERHAGAMEGDVIVPAGARGRGKTISATVPLVALGEGNPAGWGYQVLVFAESSGDRPVRFDVHRGQHRIGGLEGPCGPRVLDLLAGEARAEASELALQHRMLAYECGDDAEPVRGATLRMIRRGGPAAAVSAP